MDNWYTYTKRYKNGIMTETLKISDELERGWQLKERF